MRFKTALIVAVIASAGLIAAAPTRCRRCQLDARRQAMQAVGSRRSAAGTGTCPGVRPGAVVNNDAGQCTFQLPLHGVRTAAVALGTAGAISARAPSRRR